MVFLPCLRVATEHSTTFHSKVALGPVRVVLIIGDVVVLDVVVVVDERKLPSFSSCIMYNAQTSRRPSNVAVGSTD